MSDVTRILSAIEQGDPLASSRLLPLVYDELRKLAAAKTGAASFSVFASILAAPFRSLSRKNPSLAATRAGPIVR